MPHSSRMPLARWVGLKDAGTAHTKMNTPVADTFRATGIFMPSLFRLSPKESAVRRVVEYPRRPPIAPSACAMNGAPTLVVGGAHPIIYSFQYIVWAGFHVRVKRSFPLPPGGVLAAWIGRLALSGLP